MLLTQEGRLHVAQIARTHGFSPEAAEAMLAALVSGNGSQAQFNHPELGGMGQWSSGGMLMIGDMFNNGLKSRVDGLAQELAGLVPDMARFRAPQSQASDKGWFASTSVWPAELGIASSSGSQNDMQYAVFASHRRLAVMRGGRLSVYDTGDHIIGGVSQQQGGGNSLLFSSQHGPVALESLAPVSVAGASTPASRVDTPPVLTPEPPAPEIGARAGPVEEHSIIAKIEQIHALFTRGILTQSEFETKKAELLSRL